MRRISLLSGPPVDPAASTFAGNGTSGKNGPSAEGRIRFRHRWVCRIVGHHDQGDGGLFVYDYSTVSGRQHPARRGVVLFKRVGYECARCGTRVLS
jgi:hypothetical protein